jgi:hypothetical protein
MPEVVGTDHLIEMLRTVQMPITRKRWYCSRRPHTCATTRTARVTCHPGRRGMTSQAMSAPQLCLGGRPDVAETTGRHDVKRHAGNQERAVTVNKEPAHTGYTFLSRSTIYPMVVVKSYGPEVPI